MRHRWETTFQNAIGDKWSGEESRNPHYCDAGRFAQPASADLLILRGIWLEPAAKAAAGARGQVE
jgi:hypothetical protein